MRSTFVHIRILFFTIAILFTNTARAQGPDQDERVRLRSELVQIDAVILDKSGRPVTDLKKEDFTIYENKQQQQISFFSLVQLRGSANRAGEATVPGAPAGDEGASSREPGRFIFLIFDHHHISRDSHARLRTALLRFITEDVSPQDHLAIINLSGGMAAFQQATRNKEVISLAVDAMLRRGARDAKPLIADNNSTLSARDLGGLSSDLTKAADATFYSAIGEYRIRNTLRDLEKIVRNVSRTPGRKLAILISEYLPIFADESSLTSDAPDFSNFSYELRRIIGASKRSGMVFYSLDPQGLVAVIPGGSAAGHQPKGMFGGPTRPDEPFRSLDALSQSRSGMRWLAEATGGAAFFNSNDLHIGLKKALEENEAYYSLGYYPSDSAEDGKFRRVRIEIKDRPDLTVKNRQGYMAENEADLKGKPVSDQDRIIEAIGSLVPLQNVRVSFKAVPAATAGLGRNIVVQVTPDPQLLKQAGDQHVATIEVRGFVYNIQNKLVDGFSKTVKLNLNADRYAQMLRTGIALPSEVKFKKPGLYNVRVAVLEKESGEIGTAADWVYVK